MGQDDPFADVGSIGGTSQSEDDLFGDLPDTSMSVPSMPTVAATPAPKPASSPHSQTSNANEYIAKAQAEKTFYGESNQAQGTGAIFSGIGMMVGAVVWFVAGLCLGYIFFYPPVLFVIGAITSINGIGLKMRD